MIDLEAFRACVLGKLARYRLNGADVQISSMGSATYRVVCQHMDLRIILDLAPDARLDMTADELATHAVITLANRYLGKPLPPSTVTAPKPPARPQLTARR